MLYRTTTAKKGTILAYRPRFARLPLDVREVQIGPVQGESAPNFAVPVRDFRPSRRSKFVKMAQTRSGRVMADSITWRDFWYGLVELEKLGSNWGPSGHCSFILMGSFANIFIVIKWSKIKNGSQYSERTVKT